MSDIASISGSAGILANQRELSQSLREVASGSRLNSAADGAAELAIATVLSSEDAVLAQAAVNTSGGVSLAQVADGGLAQISEGLVRLKELAAKATNGALDDSARDAINAEFVQIRDEISEIAGQTRFNGESLLDGPKSFNFLAGSAAGDNIGFSTVDATADGLGIAGIEVGSGDDVVAALTAVDGAIDQVAEARADLGATIERFEQRGENIASQQEALSSARSALQDSDLAAAISKAVSSGIRSEAESYSIAQANKSAQQLLRVLA